MASLGSLRKFERAGGPTGGLPSLSHRVIARFWSMAAKPAKFEVEGVAFARSQVPPEGKKAASAFKLGSQRRRAWVPVDLVIASHYRLRVSPSGPRGIAAAHAIGLPALSTCWRSV